MDANDCSLYKKSNRQASLPSPQSSRAPDPQGLEVCRFTFSGFQFCHVVSEAHIFLGRASRVKSQNYFAGMWEIRGLTQVQIATHINVSEDSGSQDIQQDVILVIRTANEGVLISSPLEIHRVQGSRGQAPWFLPCTGKHGEAHLQASVTRSSTIALPGLLQGRNIGATASFKAWAKGSAVSNCNTVRVVGARGSPATPGPKPKLPSPQNAV